MKRSGHAETLRERRGAYRVWRDTWETGTTWKK